MCTPCHLHGRPPKRWQRGELLGRLSQTGDCPRPIYRHIEEKKEKRSITKNDKQQRNIFTLSIDELVTGIWAPYECVMILTHMSSSSSQGTGSLYFVLFLYLFIFLSLFLAKQKYLFLLVPQF